ncbi:MAG: MASE3 domain-containing protein [Pseudomonadota bacterium]
MHQESPARGPGSTILWQAILGALALSGLTLTRLHSYLLFHTLAEFFSIVVACAVFILAWNARRFMDQGYLLFLGVSSLFVGGVDLLHALAFQGVGVLGNNGANLATQLWIVARYLQAGSWLAAPWFLRRRVRAAPLLASGGLATGLALAAIFSGHFPDCFLEGSGLTPFKIVSEYLIVALLGLAGLWLWRHRLGLERRVWSGMLAAVALSMASELAFTAYSEISGLANLLGHLCKIMAFYLIYQAVIVTGLRQPYDLLFRELKRGEQELRQSEQTARTLLNAPRDAALLLDLEGFTVAANQAAAREMGASPEELRGRLVWEYLPAEVADTRRALLQQAVRTGQMARLQDQHGGRWLDIAVYPLLDEQGVVWRLAVFSRDITERKLRDQERERLLAQLQKALAEVKTLSGLLPICAHCKRIRDDKGEWERIENYISRRSQAEFTHAICPDCAQRFYPELMDK